MSVERRAYGETRLSVVLNKAEALELMSCLG